MVAFHPLDLLAHDTALAFLLAQAAAAMKASRADGGGDGGGGDQIITEVVVFLYVYPTLLARLGGLIEALAGSLSDWEGVGVQVVSLTYHFEDDAAPRLAPQPRDDGDDRFVVYRLRQESVL